MILSPGSLKLDQPNGTPIHHRLLSGTTCDFQVEVMQPDTLITPPIDVNDTIFYHQRRRVEEIRECNRSPGLGEWGLSMSTGSRGASASCKFTGLWLKVISSEDAAQPILFQSRLFRLSLTRSGLLSHVPPKGQLGNRQTLTLHR